MDIISQLQEQVNTVAALEFNTLQTLRRDALPIQLSPNYPEPQPANSNGNGVEESDQSRRVTQDFQFRIGESCQAEWQFQFTQSFHYQSLLENPNNNCSWLRMTQLEKNFRSNWKLLQVNDLADASDSYGTLNNILDLDKHNDTVKTQGSLSRNLRRVRQGLDLIRAIFQNFLSTDYVIPSSFIVSSFSI
ncbi:glycolipid transfer protein, partial [Striga asiatica]